MNIEIFKNNDFKEIRVIEIENEPWFVGKDIAENLGYKDTSDAIKRHIDNEDKLTRCFTDSGQSREMIVINESGLYSLILSSKLPTAKKFKRWVTSDILPTIRKHGMYAKDELLENPDLLIATLQELKKEREQKLVLEQKVNELQPKANYYDVVLNCKEVVPISVIAKDYGLSGKALNQKLKDLGVQYKQGSIWLLYQKYARNGYTQTKTHTFAKNDGCIGSNVFTYWTQKGRLFIYDLLKDNGVLPLIEVENEYCYWR